MFLSFRMLHICSNSHLKLSNNKRWWKGWQAKKDILQKEKWKYFGVESPPCLHEAGSEVYLKHGKKEKKGKIGRKKERKKGRKFLKERKILLCWKPGQSPWGGEGGCLFLRKPFFWEFSNNKQLSANIQGLIFQKQHILYGWKVTPMVGLFYLLKT